MNTRKDILKQLLNREKWDQRDEEWMTHYLEGNDLSDLEEVAREAYQADLAAGTFPTGKHLSAQLLHGIHQHIDVPTPVAPRRVNTLMWWLRVATVVVLLAVQTPVSI